MSPGEVIWGDLGKTKATDGSWFEESVVESQVSLEAPGRQVGNARLGSSGPPRPASKLVVWCGQVTKAELNGLDWQTFIIAVEKHGFDNSP